MREKRYNFHNSNHSTMILFATMPEYSHKMTQAKITKEDCPLKFNCSTIHIGIKSRNVSIHTIRPLPFCKSFVYKRKPCEKSGDLMIIQIHSSKCLISMVYSIRVTTCLFSLFDTYHHANITSEFSNVSS